MGLFNRHKKEAEPIQEPKIIPVQEKVYTARIVGCNLRDDGLREYILLTNSKLGEIGEEFDL